MADNLFAKYGRQAQPPEVLFRAGEKGGEMFVVRTGMVRVFVEADGVEKTLALLGPGEFVGEMSLLTDEPRTATAVVHAPSELLVVGQKVLEEMIVANAEIALRLLRKLARRLQATDALVQVLLFRDATTRVVENLKRLHRLHGSAGAAELRIAADATAMAEQVGLSVDEVQEIASRLMRAGALTETEGLWVVRDPERLGEVLEFLRLKDQFR